MDSGNGVLYRLAPIRARVVWRGTGMQSRAVPYPRPAEDRSRMGVLVRAAPTPVDSETAGANIAPHRSCFPLCR